MLEIDKKMVELLKEGATFLNLKNKSGLCTSDLVKKINSLENRGYLIHKLFYDYGVKFQILNKPILPLKDNVEILGGPKFSFLVFGDTHLGHIDENLEDIYRAYEYAEDNNYRYVIHLGDMLEGPHIFNQSAKRIKRDDVHEQVDFLTRNYPKSDKVETLYILGNHDNRCFNEGIDISRVIEHRRLDMHFLGYQNCKLKIGDINVLLHHPFTISREVKYDDEIKDLYFNTDFDLILRGHTHHAGMYVSENGGLVLTTDSCLDNSKREFKGLYGITIKNNEMEIDNLVMGKEISTYSVVKHKFTPKQLIKTPQT